MPKTKISEYSVTNSSNTDIEGINIDEGCAPSGINNAIRELMVHLKEFQTGASGDAFTFAGGVLISGTANTITGNVLMSGTNTITGSTTATFAAGAVGTPSIAAHGDTNTGIFFPAADTIAFAEGGAEAMRIDSSGTVMIGTSTNAGGRRLNVVGRIAATNSDAVDNQLLIGADAGEAFIAATYASNGSYQPLTFYTSATERMRITSSGNVGIGVTSPDGLLTFSGAQSNTPKVRWQNSTVDADAALSTFQDSNGTNLYIGSNFYCDSGGSNARFATGTPSAGILVDGRNGVLQFLTNTSSGVASERARIASGGDFIVNSTSTGGSDSGTKFAFNVTSGYTYCQSSDAISLYVNRNVSDGTVVSIRQANVEEGSISVSGTTVSYNSFAGSHWSQLQQGRGYNPEILRGTVMSTIGEMCEWKSVVWDEVIEHPAVPAVEAKEAVLDEEGNVVEPAVEAVEGKEAWTETFNKREAYLGNLAVGATFTEDGVTKTVVDDGNERLPKVKISDVVGDRAVYGVFQTWDEVQDMLVTSLGAFVVRIAAGVTVQIGDLLESNGDGCAKVQDDDVIRSKTIGKVTSTTPSATYADGSYTVPAVLYCG